jgi:integrase
VPDPADVAALIEAGRAVNDGLGLFIRLAAVSGARRGELCALRWRHVDLEHAELHVEGSLVEVGRDLIEKDTKTHAERRVSLDTGTVDALRAYRSSVEEILAVAEARRSDEGFIFSHEIDGSRPWRPNYVTLAFSRLARAHGLAGLRLHDLRHFAATTMLTAGVDVRTAAGRLGHANTSTTLDVYSHFVKRADQGAAVLLAAALDADGPTDA